MRGPRERGSVARRKYSEAGAIAFAIVCLLLGVISIGLAATAWVAKETKSGGEQAKIDYLRQVESRVRDWYELNASTIDGSDAVFTGASVLASAGVSPKYAIRIGVSNRLGLPCDASAAQATCVAYRKIAIWIPAPSAPDGSQFDVGTGELAISPNVKSTSISGREIELRKVADSMSSLGAIQVVLQNYFSVKQRTDAVSSIDKNWFRTTACAAPDQISFPCVDDWTNGDETTIPQLVGLPANAFRDAWGNSIQISNLQHSAITAAPFSMALKTGTPWGTSLEMQVIQPM